MTGRIGRILGLPLLFLTLAAAAGCTPQFFDATSWSSVVAAGESPVVYYGSKFGGVVALNVDTQQQVWRQPVPSGNATNDALKAVYSTPVLHNGLLHFGDYGGGVYAVSADGAVAWQKTIPGHVLTDAVLYQKSPTETVVLYGSSDGEVHAFDSASGSELWTFSTGDKPIWGIPAIVSGTLYVPSMNGTLYAVDLATGAEAWKYATGGPLAGSVAVDSANIIFGSFDKNLYALDVNTRTPAWTFPGGNWFWTRAAVYNGVLYAGGLDHNIYALDPATGVEKWRFTTGGAVRATPTLVNDRLIVGSEDGSVYALTLNGVQSWKQPLGVAVYAQATAVGDTVYVTGQDGQLYAMDAATGVRRWAFDSQKREG
jgi:serine/threonine-protein kinase